MEQDSAYESYDEYLKTTFAGYTDEDLVETRRRITRLKQEGSWTKTDEDADRRVRHIEAEQARRRREKEAK